MSGTAELLSELQTTRGGGGGGGGGWGGGGVGGGGGGVKTEQTPQIILTLTSVDSRG